MVDIRNSMTQLLHQIQILNYIELPYSLLNLHNAIHVSQLKNELKQHIF